MTEPLPSNPNLGPKNIGEIEKNALAEAYASGMMGSHESIHTDLIVHAGSPAEFYWGLRPRFEFKDSGLIAPSLSNDYRDPGLLSSIFERSQILRLTPEELIHRGWVVRDSYDPATGMAVLKRRYGSIVIDHESTRSGSLNGANVLVGDIGTSARRAAMELVYVNGFIEMNARTITGEQIGVLLNLDVRDDLATLVSWEHSTASTYKAEHFQSLFNLPSIREMEEIPKDNLTVKEIREKHELGDQIEESMLAELIMLKSGSKQDMKNLLARPGTQFLISKMAKEEEARRQKSADEEARKYGTQVHTITFTYDDWVAEFIGDVDSWADDMDRNLKTWKEERNDKSDKYINNKYGRRGRLTKWGNLCAFTGDPGEISTDEETYFIEKEVGAASGSVEAAWIATTLFRNIGLFASEGYIALPNGISNIPLGEFKFITGDDRGKFYPYMFVIKEGIKGRSAELAEMIYRAPDMAMNLFDWAQVTVDDVYERDETGLVIYGEDGRPKVARRSVIDAWLGTAEQAKIDLVTGQYAEYGIKAIKVDQVNDEADKMLVAKGKLVLIKGPHPKTGKEESFYVTKEDWEKIQSGKKVKDEDYDKIFDPPKGKTEDEIDRDRKYKEEIKDRIARLVKISDPDGKNERKLYMTARDEDKIKNGGGILIKEINAETRRTTRIFYGKKVQEEGYHRLGSLNWGSLERYFHGTFGTMQWLMGRKEGGVLTEIKNVDDFGPGDFSLKKLKSQRKYNGIALNLITLTKGSPHLFDAGRVTVDGTKTYEIPEELPDGSTKLSTLRFHEVQTTGTETIQRTLLKNQLAARIHTSNWVLNIMTKPTNPYNLAKVGGGRTEEVPLSNVLEMFAKEALKPFPKDEDEIIRNYVDDLSRLQTPIDRSQPLKFYKEMGDYLKSWKSTLVGVRKGAKARYLYERLN